MAKKQEKAAGPAVGEFVELKIPVGRLVDTGGYCESRGHVPRELRSRRLTLEQGQALARIRLGMLARGEMLGGTRSSLVGGTYEPAVSSKEEVICRLLELVHDAIGEQLEG